MFCMKELINSMLFLQIHTHFTHTFEVTLEILLHSAQSHDLAPGAIHLFQPFKDFLRNQKLDRNDQFLENNYVKQMLISLSISFTFRLSRSSGLVHRVPGTTTPKLNIKVLLSHHTIRFIRENKRNSWNCFHNNVPEPTSHSKIKQKYAFNFNNKSTNKGF